MSSENKPREFWIADDYDNGLHVSDEKHQGYDIHVIEKEAYDQVIELLKKVIRQDRAKGYPTGIEWTELVREIKESKLIEE